MERRRYILALCLVLALQNAFVQAIYQGEEDSVLFSQEMPVGGVNNDGSGNRQGRELLSSEDGLVDGASYTIQVALEKDTNQCNGRYLGYLNGTRRVFLHSSTMKYPPSWRIRRNGDGIYLLDAEKRVDTIRTKKISDSMEEEVVLTGSLAYSPNCRSKRPYVSTVGRLQWRLVEVDSKEGLYRVVATSKHTCKSPYLGRLAPKALTRSHSCEKETSVELMPVSRETLDIMWRLTKVNDPPPPPTTTPPPPPPTTTSPPFTPETTIQPTMPDPEKDLLSDPALLGCAGSEWTTIFEDNFDVFDSSKWSHQLYDGYQYSIGEWGNAEKQWYTNLTSNTDVRDGKLVITARKEADTSWMWQNCWDECAERCRKLGYSGLEMQYCTDGCGWPRCDVVRERAITSSRIRTFQKFSVSPSEEFGTIRIEGHINLPKAAGLWPAFWLLPEEGATEQCSGCGSYGDWPLSGEIDVMESFNDMQEVLGTLHFGNPFPGNVYLTSSTPMPTSEEPSSGYHTYALEWSASSMKWFFDGQHYGTVTSEEWFTSGRDPSGLEPSPSAPFDRNFHLLLNMAVGGNLAEAKYNDVKGMQLDLPTIQNEIGEGKEMLVDWVRVCGQKN